MQARILALSLSALLALSLGACSPESADTSAAASAPIAQGQAYEAVAKDAKGFTAGALMGANPVYVLFDPQCPHCSHLWEAAAAAAQQGEVHLGAGVPCWAPRACPRALRCCRRPTRSKP